MCQGGTWTSPPVNFDVRWNGTPVTKAPIWNRLNVDVRFGTMLPGNVSPFEEWRAMIHCNATLDEIYEWWRGGYPPGFKADVVAFYLQDTSLDTHIKDASQPKNKKRK